jgi:hypothetical protein
MRAQLGRVALGTVVIVALLVTVHFFVVDPRRTRLAVGLVLVLFFAPPALAIWRLPPHAASTLAGDAVRYLVIGFVLGLLAGLVGAAVKIVLHAVTRVALPTTPVLWASVAVIFALAAGLSYGLLLCLVRAVWALVRTPAPAELFADMPSASRAGAVLLSLVPGLGHAARGRPRAARWLLLAVAVAGLSGLVAVVVAAILLVEGGVPTLSLFAVGAALLIVVPLALAAGAALDVVRPARGA